MNAREPAWRAELLGTLDAITEWSFEKGPGLTDAGMELVMTHIDAAYRRGYEAGKDSPRAKSTQAAEGGDARCTCPEFDSGHQSNCPLLAVHTCGEPSPCSHVRAKLRTAVLREAIAAARGEYLTDDTGHPEDTAYNRGVSDAIDAIGAVAEYGKDTRPGHQPGTGESTQAADFFQPGHTYRSQRHANLIFKCMALSADPDSGEQQAIGWRFGPPRQGIRRYRIAALDADDWNCCDWTEAGGPDA